MMFPEKIQMKIQPLVFMSPYLWNSTKDDVFVYYDNPTCLDIRIRWWVGNIIASNGFEKGCWIDLYVRKEQSFLIVKFSSVM